jgi:hypothetical protein
VKIRHGTFTPGTLVGAYAGLVNSIRIAGLPADPTPDTRGAGAPFFYGGGSTGNYSHVYPHGGLRLQRAADGYRDTIDYTSWTYDAIAGVYTFAVNATLRFIYAGGEVAGPVKMNCLRNSLGDKVYELHRLINFLAPPGEEPHLNLCFANYVDGDLNVAACGLPNVSLPVWPNVLPWSNSGTDWAYWQTSTSTPYYSISNKRLYYMSLRKINTTWPNGAGLYYDLTRWFLSIYLGSWGEGYWNGYKECGSSSPAGVYTKYAGCVANATIELGVLPP